MFKVVVGEFKTAFCTSCIEGVSRDWKKKRNPVLSSYIFSWIPWYTFPIKPYQLGSSFTVTIL